MPAVENMFAGTSLFEQELPDLFAGRLRFGRDDCEEREQFGVIKGRYELLDGVIIDKIGHNLPHTIAVSRIVFYLMGVWGPDRVFSQTTLEVPNDLRSFYRPEPDAYVLDRSVSLFTNTPMTGETVLVVEVADASLRNDLGLKAALFARTGVPEFRVLDVNGRKLYAHRGPDDGGYGEIRVFSADETLSPVSMPDAVVRIADLLPPLRSAI